MFHVLVALQIIGIIVPVAEIFYMIPKISGNNHGLILLMAVETFIDCAGYLLEITSDTVETAFMGTKICYIGRVYLLLTVFLFVLNSCKVRVPKPLIAVMFAFHSSILGLVLFAENTALYYSSIQFVSNGLFPHLEFGHGIMYTVFQVVTYLYFLIMFVLLLGRLNTEKNKFSKRKTTVMLSILGVSLLCTVLYSVGITGGYDTLSLGLVISSFILTVGILRCDMLSTVDSAKNFIVDNMETGVVVLDDSDNIVYHNAVISKIFPEIISNTPTVVSNIENCSRTGDKIFCGERVYMVRKERSGKSAHSKVYILPNITNTYNYMERLEQEVNEKTDELKKIQHAIIVSFANIVETRDGFTGQHIKNTSRYVAIIAKAMQKLYPNLLSNKDVDSMIQAAPLHDIGKISIPDSILCKAGKLTDEEYGIMKSHSKRGADIISEMLEDIGYSRYLETAKDMAFYHHERWDGNGYPNGVKGENIPLSARIMAVADVYDALRSRRCYKEGLSEDESLSIIKDGSGTQFDPEIVSIFVKNISEIEKVSG